MYKVNYIHTSFSFKKNASMYFFSEFAFNSMSKANVEKKYSQKSRRIKIILKGKIDKKKGFFNKIL